MPECAPQLFIADLHLQGSTPAISELALEFLRAARGVARLYVLGDLFEYWVGDDAPMPGLQPIIDALRALADTGTELYLMHGNRDFLLGNAFAARIGGTLLKADVHLVCLGELRVALLHGDTLCTADTDYQRWRTQLRQPHWQQRFLAHPAAERLRIADGLRRDSRAAGAAKPDDLMDVTDTAVNRLFDDTDADILVHGHTHRPAEHVHMTARGPRRRLVLGDWHTDHAVIGRWHNGELLLERFER